MRNFILATAILWLGLSHRTQAQCTTGCDQTYTLNSATQTLSFTVGGANRTICIVKNPSVVGNTTITSGTIDINNRPNTVLCFGPGVVVASGVTISNPNNQFSINNYGTLQNSLTLSQNQQAINNYGTISGPVSISGGSTVNNMSGGIFSASSFTFQGNFVNNAGSSFNLPTSFSADNGANFSGSGSFAVTGNFSTNNGSSVNVGGPATISGTVSTTTPVTFGSTLAVGGNLNSNNGGAITIVGNTTVGGSVNTSASGITFGGSLSVTGSMSTGNGGPVTVAGAVTIGGGLSTGATTTFNSTLSVTGAVAVNNGGPLTVSGATTIGGGITTGATTNFGSNLAVTGNITVNNGGPLTVSGNTSATGALSTSATTNLGGTLTVGGSATVNNGGPLTVSGASTIGGNLTTSATTNFGSTLGVTGNVIANNGGPIALSSNLTVGGYMSVGTTVSIGGATIISNTGNNNPALNVPNGGTITVSGGGNVTGNYQGGGTTNFSGTLSFTGSINNPNGGTITSASGTCKTLCASSITNGGTISSTSGPNMNVCVTPSGGTQNNVTVNINPTASASGLSASVSGATVTGTFTAASPTPGGYMVLRKTSPFTPADMPLANTTYSVGSTIGGATVAAFLAGSATSFTNTNGCGTFYYAVVSSSNNSGTCGTFFTSTYTSTGPVAISCNGPRYWVSSSASNWNSTANWSFSSGGTGGASVPTSANLAIFDNARNGNCTIDATVDVLGIQVSGYTGTISQNTNPMTLGANGYSQTSGTFTGGSAAITINNNGLFSLSGGTYTSTSGTATISGSFNNNTTLFNHSAGTFNHNSGTWVINPTLISCANPTLVIDVIPATLFFNLEINGIAGCGINAIISTGAGDVVACANNFTHTDGVIAGAFSFRGNLSISTGADGGTGTLTANGTGAQTHFQAAGSPRTCQLIVNKSSGAFTPAVGSTNLTTQGFSLVAGSFTAPSGTLNVGGNWGSSVTLFNHSGGTFTHNSGTVEFNPTLISCANPTLTVDIIPATAFFNFSVNGIAGCGINATLTTAAGDVIACANNLTHNDGIIAGAFSFQNNLIINAGADGGTGTITANGTGAQTYFQSSVSPRTCQLIVNKSSGALTPAVGCTELFTQGFQQLAGNFTAPTGTFNVGGPWGSSVTIFSHQAGTFSHNNGIVEFNPTLISCANPTFTVDVIPATLFNEFVVNGIAGCGINATISTAAGDVVQAASDFTHADGIIAGNFAFRGNLWITAGADGGTGTITANGTGAQTYYQASVSPRTCQLIVNKSAGALTPAMGCTDISTQGFQLLAGNFTAPTGTLNVGGPWGSSVTIFSHQAGNFTHNNGTVEFNPNLISCANPTFTVDVIPSTLLYNYVVNGIAGCGINATVSSASGDLVQAANDFTHTDGIIAGNFAFRNNLVINAGADGGTGTITANGTGAQTYFQAAGSPRTCQLIVNKTSGALTPAVGAIDLWTQGFQQLAGDFTAPTGTLNVGGPWGSNVTIFSHQAGNFTHNNGTLEFNPNLINCASPTFTVDVIPSTLLNHFVVNGIAGCGINATVSTAAGDVVQGAGNFTHTDGIIAGNFAFNGNLVINAGADGGTGTILANGSGAQTYFQAAGTPRTCQLIVTKPAGTFTPTGGTTDLLIQGFILNSGSFTAPTGTLNVGGNWGTNVTIFSHQGGTFLHNNGTVEFNPTLINCANPTFTFDVITGTQLFNFRVNGINGCGINATLVTAAGDTLDVLNNLTYNDGVCNGMIEAGGNVTVNPTFDSGTGRLIFKGGNAQNFDLTGATGLFDGPVVMNKTSNSVTLLSACQLDAASQSITWNAGVLNTTATNLLIIGNNVTSGPGNNSSFANGPVRKMGNQAFTFPTGKGTKFGQIFMSAPSVNTDQFTAEYFGTNPNGSWNVSTKEATVTTVSTCEYWLLDRNVGASNVAVRLSWDNSRSCAVSNINEQRVGQWNGSQWINQGTSGAPTGNTTAGTVQSCGNISTFGASNPLTNITATVTTISYAGAPFCRSETSPQPVTFSGISGGTFTSSPAGLTIDASTGAITPSSSTAGTYTINYSVSSSTACVNPLATTTVTITAMPVASINYTTSPWCVTNGSAQAVTRTGAAGGTYSASPAGLTINSSTGAVTPNTSTPNTYTITYTIAAAAGCAAITPTATVVVTPSNAATISYTGSPFCTSASPQMVNQTGTTGGTFTATAGLTINSTTGEIDPSTSTAGAKTITYTMAATGGCAAATATTSVTITTAPSATISYAGPFCRSLATGQNPTRTGTAGGTYSSTAGLTIISAGVITPFTSTAGTYTVTYSIAAAGGCAAFSTTTSVTITPVNAATISYTGSPYCTTTSVQTVNQTGTTGGTFTATAGLTINSSTGEIDPSASTAGAKTITYTMAATGGCAAATATTSVTITTAPSATISYAGPFCRSLATGQNPTRTGTAGGNYSSTAGLTITSAGVITPSTSTAGTYTVTYSIAAAGGCAAFSTTTSVSITALPTIGYSGPYCTSIATAQPVTQTGVMGGTYSASPSGLVLDASSGAITPSGSTGNAYTVTYTYPASGGCAAGTTNANVTITTLPAATISYPAAAVCNNAGTQAVTRTGTAGGTFSVSPSGLSINSGTGLITVSSSTPNTYTVSYTIAASGGCPAVVTTTSITIHANPVAPTAGVNGSRCFTGTVDISATAPTGSVIDWYAAASGGSVLVGGSGSSSFTTPNIAATTIYYAESRNTTTGCVSTTRRAVTATVNITNPPTGVSASGCGPGTVGLSAIPAAGEVVNWFATPTGGSSLILSNTYSPPYITTTTTFYAQTTNTTTGCVSQTRTPVVATINPLPNLNVSSNGAVCIGTNTFSLPYSAATNGANQYRIDWSSAANAAGLADVPWTTIPAGAITISGIPASAGSYTASFFVRNSTTGCTSPIGSSLLCGTAAEHSSITLTAPPGGIITSINFASYGTAAGSCGGFSQGSCHAANSMTVVQAACVGQNSCTVSAENSIFGDPCVGTYKQLFIEAVSDAPDFTLVVENYPTAPGTVTNAGRCGPGTVTIGATPGSGQTLDWYAASSGGSILTGGTGTSSFTTPSISSTTTYYAQARTILAGCLAPTRAAVTATISPVNSATISYTGSPFCTSAPNQTVNLSGTTGGIFSASAGLTIHSGTGEISPASSTSGSKTITYTMPAVGFCPQVSTNTSVVITTLPVASISYPGSPYCISAGGTGTVSLTGNSGGTYTSTAGLSLNGASGAITISSSTANTYNVTYSIAASGGCPLVSSTASVTLRNDVTTPTAISGTSPICQATASSAVSTSVSNQTSLIWSVSGSGNSISGSGTSVSVNWDPAFSGTATVSVTANGCGGPVGPVTRNFVVDPGGQWLGLTNNWNAASNWCGGIPTPTTDVIIPTGASNMPQINAASFVNNLTIQPGSSLTINGSNSLSINGTFTNGGTFSPSASSTVSYDGNGAQSIPALNYGNLSTSGTGTKTFASGSTTRISGTFTPAGSSHVVAGSTIEFNGTSAQNIPAFTFHNLTTSGNNAKTLTGSVVVNNQLTLSNGTLQLSNRHLTLGGAISGAGTLSGTCGSALTIGGTGATGTLNFTAGSRVLGQLNLSKAATGNVILGNDLDICSQLNLTQGKVVLGAYNLTLLSGATTTSGNTNSYVQTLDQMSPAGAGFFIQEIPNGGGELIFPVGTVESYTPAYLDNIGFTRNFRVRVFNNVYEHGTHGLPVLNLDFSVLKTWEIEPIGTGGTPDVNIKLQWNTGDEGIYFGNQRMNDKIYMGKNTGIGNSLWTKLLTDEKELSTSPYSITTARVTTFSKFGVGSDEAPLPVVLGKLAVEPTASANVLQWKTYMEREAVGFEILKSPNAVEFEQIGFVNAKGTAASYSYADKSKDRNAYYKIRFIGQSGDDVTESNVVVVRSENNGTYAFYPNPVEKQCTIEHPQWKNGDVVELLISDLKGSVQLQSPVMATDGKVQVDMAILPAGVYLIETISNGERSGKQKVVKL